MSDAAARIRCAGFVLAGGRSTRMGADKALLELVGRPLIVYALDVLRDAGLNGAIAGAHADLSTFAPVIADAEPDRGPLGGVCAALEQCDAEMALFVSVDMPLIPSSAIKYLVQHAAVTAKLLTLYSVNCFAQTFPAVIQREAVATLKAELAANRRGCFAAFDAAARERGECISVLPVEYLAQVGRVRDERGLPPARWFANVNTREELALAERWLHPAVA